jgi:hypothetical protein
MVWGGLLRMTRLNEMAMALGADASRKVAFT